VIETSLSSLIVLTTERTLPAWLRGWNDRLGGELLGETPGPQALAAVLLRPQTRFVILHLGASANAKPCATWAGELHRRRPGIVFIALAEADDSELERAMRAAGSDFYVASETELSAVITSLGDPAHVPEQCSRAPPQSRIRERAPPRPP
jgi:hypothetical protein